MICDWGYFTQAGLGCSTTSTAVLKLNGVGSPQREVHGIETHASTSMVPVSSSMATLHKFLPVSCILARRMLALALFALSALRGSAAQGALNEDQLLQFRDDLTVAFVNNQGGPGTSGGGATSPWHAHQVAHSHIQSDTRPCITRFVSRECMNSSSCLSAARAAPCWHALNQQYYSATLPRQAWPREGASDSKQPEPA